MRAGVLILGGVLLLVSVPLTGSTAGAKSSAPAARSVEAVSAGDAAKVKRWRVGLRVYDGLKSRSAVVRTKKSHRLFAPLRPAFCRSDRPKIIRGSLQTKRKGKWKRVKTLKTYGGYLDARVRSNTPKRARFRVVVPTQDCLRRGVSPVLRLRYVKRQYAVKARIERTGTYEEGLNGSFRLSGRVTPGNGGHLLLQTRNPIINKFTDIGFIKDRRTGRRVRIPVAADGTFTFASGYADMVDQFGWVNARLVRPYSRRPAIATGFSKREFELHPELRPG